MALSPLINEDEFDRLPEQTQANYLYCPMCGMFYLVDDKHNHKCNIK